MTSHHRYLDAKVAHYKKSRFGFTVIKRRPRKYFRKDGTWFPMKAANWNIPWHIVESTMSDETIESLNNDFTAYQRWDGTFSEMKGPKWNKTIKAARKEWAKILMQKQAEGKILCVTGAKIWRYQSGNLVELIEEDGKYFILGLGDATPRKWKMGWTEIQNLSWLED